MNRRGAHTEKKKYREYLVELTRMMEKSSISLYKKYREYLDEVLRIMEKTRPPLCQERGRPWAGFVAMLLTTSVFLASFSERALGEQVFRPETPVCDWGSVGYYPPIFNHPRNAPVIFNVHATTGLTNCDVDLNRLEVSVTDPNGYPVPGTVSLGTVAQTVVWTPLRAMEASTEYTVSITFRALFDYHSSTVRSFSLSTAAYSLPTQLDIAQFQLSVDSQLEEFDDCCQRAKCAGADCQMCWLEVSRQLHLVTLYWTLSEPEFAKYFDAFLLVAAGGEMLRFEVLAGDRYATEVVDSASPLCVSLELKALGSNSSMASRVECVDVPVGTERSPEPVDFGVCAQPWNYNDHPLRANDPIAVPSNSDDDGCSLRSTHPPAAPSVLLLVAVLLVFLPRRR